MAIQQDNLLTCGIRGMIGNLLVFRHRGGKLVIAKKPRSPRKPASPQQEACRSMFKRCIRYTQTITEEQHALYLSKAKGGQTAKNVAFMDAYYPPKITAIAAEAYTGLPDELICIEATDNIRVTGVRVEIRTAAGELVESGEASDDGSGENWTYHTTAANPALPGSTITAIARDNPGNLASETVVTGGETPLAPRCRESLSSPRILATLQVAPVKRNIRQADVGNLINMPVLHNRVSNEELKKRLMAEDFARTTISFYRYFPVQNPQEFRDYLYRQLNALQVFGRIYVAKEGINAQISVPSHHFDAFKDVLYSIEPMHGLRLNIAVDDDGKSFWVLAIKVRDKIVADGITDPGFSMENKGRYVNAEQMNRMLESKDTIVIDMRNHYEYEVGHFNNAIEIPSDTFREQLPMAVDMMKGNEEKNIIMYCTGGIRCEKASAYMLHNGFRNVFHLEGGIINYAKQVKDAGLDSRFTGKNFVFDNRLGERITDDVIAHCHQCGKPCDTHTNCRNNGCHLLFIQCEACAAAFDGCCSPECRDTVHLPAERQKEIRKGVENGRNIFNKSRVRLRPRIRD